MVNIKNGDLIKHEKFLDVCLEVRDVFDYGHGLKIRGVWWNMGFVESYSMGITVTLNVAKNSTDIASYRRTDISQWQVLSHESFLDSCFRNSKWLKAG